MDKGLIFIAVVLPALMYIPQIVIKTRTDWRGEPVWIAFFLGGVAAVCCLCLAFFIALVSLWLKPIIAPGLSPIWAAEVRAFLVAAFPEELMKLLVLTGLVLRHADVRRKQDIVALAAIVGLGFAAIENITYVVDAGAAWHKTAWIRAVAPMPSHLADGLVMGAALTFACLPGRSKLIWSAAALVLPVIAHGVWDGWFFVEKIVDFSKGERVLLASLLMLVEGVFAVSISSRALRAAYAFDNDSRDIWSGLNWTKILLGVGLPLIGMLPMAFLIQKFSHLLTTQLLAVVAIISILPIIYSVNLWWWYLRRKRWLRPASDASANTVKNDRDVVGTEEYCSVDILANRTVVSDKANV